MADVVRVWQIRQNDAPQLQNINLTLFPVNHFAIRRNEHRVGHSRLPFWVKSSLHRIRVIGRKLQVP